MSVWDLYQQRTNVRGDTKRMTQYNREVRTLRNKLPDNLSYQTVDIYDIAHGYNICDREPLQQELAIINSDNLNEKMIYSMPEQDIVHGGLVHWMDNYWLITERDANTNIYARAKMVQCNHLLRWVSDEDEIIEQWCIVEDGTKLKHIDMCNSLVYRKRYAKRIPLIAGNPLEPYSLQRGLETKASAIA